MLLQTVSNHPVHIMNSEGDLSPSSFIPFCAFGEKFMGTKTNEYDIPVCNIFKPRNYLDQVCYETDLQTLKESNSQKLGEQLEMGLTLIIDFNEERQTNSNKIFNKEPFGMKAFYRNDGVSLSIYLDTISILTCLSSN